MEFHFAGVYFDLLETIIAIPLFFVSGFLGFKILRSKQSFFKKLLYLLFLIFLYKLTLFSAIYITSRIFPRWKLVDCCYLNKSGCSKRDDCLWVKSYSLIGMPSGAACHERENGEATSGCPDQLYRLFKIFP